MRYDASQGWVACDAGVHFCSLGSALPPPPPGAPSAHPRTRPPPPLPAPTLWPPPPHPHPRLIPHPSLPYLQQWQAMAEALLLN